MTKGQFRILVVLTVVFGFLGGGVSTMLLRGAPASAAGTAAVQDVVRAKSFEMVDDQGGVRARLSQDDAGRVGLAVFNVAGTRLLGLGIAADGGAGLSVCDAAGKSRVNLSVPNDGSPGLTLSDAAGKARAGLLLSAGGLPGLALLDAAGKPGASLMVIEDGSSTFDMWDATGKQRVTLAFSTGEDCPGLVLRDATGTNRAALSLLADGGRPDLHLYDGAGKTRAQLGLLADGTAGLGLCSAAGTEGVGMLCDPNLRTRLYVTDAAGKYIWQAP